MDNITHSLVGATLAELALPAGATRAQRGVFFVAGIVSANLPDADLLYTRITPPPLGSLLHHRGHTHTIAGLAVGALLLGALCMLPAVRRHVRPIRGRVAGLIAIALVSHLVLDSWNSYGIHPFWPFDSRWIYGDAIFIAEPWLWLLLGIAAALNTSHDRGRLALAALLMVPVAAAAWFRLVPASVLVALVAGA
ncbi:MAG: metal-dependent hydrolase, partial [Gemmatimonadaceae bacterium]